MNGQYPQGTLRYGSGLGSLFSVIARGTSTVDADALKTDVQLTQDKARPAVACTRCRSREIELVDHEHQIYRCTTCGKTFCCKGG